MPEELAAALAREAQRRGGSLEHTVIDLLRRSLNIDRPRGNGVARLAGTWTDAEHAEFIAAISGFNEIDADLWK